jgi:hypothetical protein
MSELTIAADGGGSARQPAVLATPRVHWTAAGTICERLTACAPECDTLARQDGATSPTMHKELTANDEDRHGRLTNELIRAGARISRADENLSS